MNAAIPLKSVPSIPDRAYSQIQIKAVDEDKRIIRGIASTPSTDRVGDIVEPLGADFKLPLPMLWQHDHEQPIGEVTSAKATKDGISIEAKIAKIDSPPGLRNRLEEAWASIKNGLVRGLSIGFMPTEYSFMDDGGIHFLRWNWFELSAVTIPANADASITSIKSLDQRLLSALGPKAGPVKIIKSARVGAARNITPTRGNKMNIQENIKDFRATLAAKSEAMNALMAKACDEGRTLDEAENAEYNELDAEIEQITQHLKKLENMEARNAAAAAPVSAPTQKGASESRAGAPQILVQRNPDEKFKGQFYTQMVIAKALAYLDQGSPTNIAMKRWGNKTHPMVVEVLKANEVAGGGSGSGEWGAELVQADGRFTGDFIEFLYSKTVFDQLPLREVPAHVTIKGQDGQGTGYWVGESKAIPATAGDFSAVTLTPLKVAALAVVSNELLRDSTPSAEMLVRDMLVNASAQRIDNTFISTAAASAGVSPAGILNGLTPGSSAGNDADAVREDINALYSGFITAKNAMNLQFVMNPVVAKTIQLMRNALGQREFPDITAMGGMLEGDPVVTGDNVNSSYLVLLKPSDIYKIGDMGITVSVSRDATIEQNTIPTGATDTPTAASATLTNMFQEESTAIKVVRPISFALRRSTAVAFINDIAYNLTGSS